MDTILAILMATLMSGDLIFVSDTTGMGQAVQQTTGVYTHVAMVERCDDSVFIIDATPTYGVSRRSLSTFRFPLSTLSVYRLTIPFDTAAVMARAHSFIGQPYDDYFMPDNGRMYCSELIQACFKVFDSKPMNWRDSDGRIPEYWQKHFGGLGTDVPEGVPGTNPTDMSRSPLLRQIKDAQ